MRWEKKMGNNVIRCETEKEDGTEVIRCTIKKEKKLIAELNLYSDKLLWDLDAEGVRRLERAWVKGGDEKSVEMKGRKLIELVKGGSLAMNIDLR